MRPRQKFKAGDTVIFTHNRTTMLVTRDEDDTGGFDYVEPGCWPPKRFWSRVCILVDYPLHANPVAA